MKLYLIALGIFVLSSSLFGMEPAPAQEERQLSPMEALPAEITLRLIQQVLKDQIDHDQSRLKKGTITCIDQLRLVNHQFKDIVADPSNFRLLANT